MLIDKVLVGEAGQQEAVQLAPRRTSPAGLASRDDSRAIRVPRGVRVVTTSRCIRRRRVYRDSYASSRRGAGRSCGLDWSFVKGGKTLSLVTREIGPIAPFFLARIAREAPTSGPFFAPLPQVGSASPPFREAFRPHVSASLYLKLESHRRREPIRC